MIVVAVVYLLCAVGVFTLFTAFSRSAIYGDGHVLFNLFASSVWPISLLVFGVFVLALTIHLTMDGRDA